MKPLAYFCRFHLSLFATLQQSMLQKLKSLICCCIVLFFCFSSFVPWHQHLPWTFFCLESWAMVGVHLINLACSTLESLVYVIFKLLSLFFILFLFFLLIFIQFVAKRSIIYVQLLLCLQCSHELQQWSIIYVILLFKICSYSQDWSSVPFKIPLMNLYIMHNSNLLVVADFRFIFAFLHAWWAVNWYANV